MKKAYWKQFFKSAAMRSLRTFLQVSASLLTVGQAFYDIDWGYIASSSLVAAIYSVLTSLAMGIPECQNCDYTPSYNYNTPDDESHETEGDAYNNRR